MSGKIIRKKVHAKGAEELIQSTGTYGFLSENFRAVVAIVVLVGVFILSYAGLNLYKAQKGKKAAEEFYMALKSREVAVDASGAAPGSVKTEDDKNKGIAKTMQDFADSHKGGSYENMALIHAASACYSLKEYDQATDLYSRVVYGESKDPNLHGNVSAFKLSAGTLRDSALIGLANSFEAKGDIEKAIWYHNTLTSSADSHLREMSLLAMGRLYEKKQDKAAAEGAYKKVVSDYPESAGAKTAKERLERLKG